MDSASSFMIVSKEEFLLFHKIDRKLYKILVINLSREPEESMQIIALCLWLERVGYRRVVKKTMSLPNTLINEVADEAVTCLNCINSSQISSSSEGNDIPLLQSLMDKEISLQLLHENRVEAIQGVAKLVQYVCVRALADIMQQVKMRNSTERMVGSSKNHICFGSIGPCYIGLGEEGVDELLLQKLTPENEVPEDERTLLVTFSKGYPVNEWEVREFFTREYGDCIEALYMQEVQHNEQAMFAWNVFHEASTIDMILGGASRAELTINGKQVWARKFVPKRTSSLLPTSPPAE